MLSVVIPAFNEEENIARAANAIGGVLREAGIDCELIFIDDGSKDGTWAEIKKAANGAAGQVGRKLANGAEAAGLQLRSGQVAATPTVKVRGVHFSRNFGKESAIYAGLAEAKGDCAVVIDCDLQHPPEKIVEMYRLWEQGYEVVEAVKSDRGKESPFHRMAAAGFYGL
ncbi:MAG: glycosyltransferase family 2 protein, partial [Lachnospiraceae bacterium]